MIKREMTSDGVTVKEGEWVSLDGTTGEVYVGQLALSAVDVTEQAELMELLNWADETSRLMVWANADYPRDAERARSYGAKGIGLCRTEHMFFETSRLPHVQKMIMNSEYTQKKLNNVVELEKAFASGRLEGRSLSDEDKAKLRAEIDADHAEIAADPKAQAYFGALDVLLPLQEGDFYGLFEAMSGLPVIIRLIDPPLHEFLPSMEDLLIETTRMKALGQTEGLREKNCCTSLKACMRATR